MYQFLVATILTMTGTLLLLTLTIVVNKLWRDDRVRWRDNRHDQLEPLVLAYARGEISIRQTTGAELHWRDRSLLEEILLAHTQTTSGKERERLTQALIHLGYVDHYIAKLNDRDWWFRAEAAEKLGKSGAPGAADLLTAALDDEMPEVRLRAAMALGELGGATAVRPLIQALSEPNRWSTIRIASILTAKGAEVVNELESAFADMNAHARLGALDILGEIGDIQAAPWLRARLDDPDPDIRSRATAALGAIHDRSAGPRLIELLADPEWPVRAMSAKALGMIEHRSAIAALCNMLRDPVWWVRTNAADALKSMGPDGLTALKNMLEDSDTYARHQAIFKLEQTGQLDHDIGGLVHEEPEMRAAAKVLITRLIDDGQLGRLQDLAEYDPDPEMRSKLSRLLTDGQGQAGATP